MNINMLRNTKGIQSDASWGYSTCCISFYLPMKSSVHHGYVVRRNSCRGDKRLPLLQSRNTSLINSTETKVHFSMINVCYFKKHYFLGPWRLEVITDSEAKVMFSQVYVCRKGGGVVSQNDPGGGVSKNAPVWTGIVWRGGGGTEEGCVDRVVYTPQRWSLTYCGMNSCFVTIAKENIYWWCNQGANSRRRTYHRSKRMQTKWVYFT